MSEESLVVGIFANTVIREEDVEDGWKYPNVGWNDLYYNLGFNRSSIIFNWAQGTEYSGEMINSTSYNGIIGLIQNQKADISFSPMSVPLEADPVNFGPYMDSDYTGLYSYIDLSNQKTNLLGNCLILKMDTVIPLIAAIACFCLLMPFFEIPRIKIRPFTLLKHHLFFLFHCICSFLLIPQYSPYSKAGKVLTSFYITAFMFFVWVWGNLLASDITVYDTSSVIDTLEDIIAQAGMKITFMQDGAHLHRQFKRATGKRYADILERETLSIKLHAATAGASFGQNEKTTTNARLFKGLLNGTATLILANKMAHCFSGSCGMFLGNFRGRMYVGNERLFPVMKAPYYGKHLNGSIVRKLDNGFRRISETGVYNAISNNYLDSFVAMAASVFGSTRSAKCIYESIDEYITDKGYREEQTVDHRHVISLFVMLLVGIGAGALALVIEAGIGFKIRPLSKWMVSNIRRLVRKVRRRIKKMTL